MKTARTILFVILGILLLIYGVALFLPKTYSVERSLVIPQPIDTLYKDISDYNAFKDWNPWSESDSTSKITVEKKPSEKGHKYSWEGEKTGKGNMEIVDIEKPTMIHSKLTFIELMASEAENYFILESTKDGTKITWKNQGNLQYPLGRYFGFMTNDVLGKSFEKGLQNLKKYSEKK